MKSLFRSVSAVILSAACLTLSACQNSDESSQSAAGLSSAEQLTALSSSSDSSSSQTTAAESTAVTMDSTSATESEHFTEQNVTEPEESTVETEPAELPADAYDCRIPFESGTRTSPISGKGFVYARSGLNLRGKPSTSSQIIVTIPFSTEIDVTALTFNGDLFEDDARWLKVKYGAKEGYVLANYVAVSCSKKGSEMDDEERAALGMLMYYQSRRILEYYIFDGALRATGVDLDHIKDMWAKLSPQGLTLKTIMDDFGKYFSMPYPYNLDNMYREENGSLYMYCETPENPYLDYDELTYLTEKSDTKLTYRAVGHWFTEGEFVMFPDNDGIEYEKFVLEYKDGVWKTAVYTPMR